jgi:type IV pilus assembly protein PilA
VELTPAEVPRGTRVQDPAGTWSHPTWVELEFALTVPHSFSFAFESHNAPGLALFRARAHGDLDGDGLHSTFEISGRSKDGAEPTVFPLDVQREVE